MKLIPKLIPDWPKLAWVALIVKDLDEVHVLHGPMVETSDDWIVEAVWAGNFSTGISTVRIWFLGQGFAVATMWWISSARERHSINFGIRRITTKLMWPIHFQH